MSPPREQRVGLPTVQYKMKIQVPQVWDSFSVTHFTVSAAVTWRSSCGTVGTGLGNR